MEQQANFFVLSKCGIWNSSSKRWIQREDPIDIFLTARNLNKNHKEFCII
nr:hypothetical protein C55B6.3 - Caenorhabditis elegans [Caenorhabditis elegans]